MRVAQLGAVLATVSVGHSLLLPPTISKADTDIVAALPIHDAAIATSEQVMEVPCPGCPVQLADLRGGRVFRTSRLENFLRFNLSLSQTSRNGGDKLMMNGIQLYPVDPQAITFGTVLVADQLVRTPNGNWGYAGTPELGFSLIIRQPVISTDEDKISLVAMHIEILDVAGKPVRIPTIDLKVLETPSGRLMIGDAQVSPSRRPLSMAYGGQECTSFICRLRAIMADKLSKAKGCGKPRPSQPRPNHQVGSVTESSPRPGHGHHVRPRPHGHPGAFRHRRHGRFARFVRGLIFHVFIPILIGIVMGITASLVGMIVGHLAIFVWRTVFRRNQRAEYQQVQSDDTDGKDACESLMEHQSPPPVYEEAPCYEEAIVDDKESS